MSDSLWVNDEVDGNGDPLGVVQYNARELRRALSALMTKAGASHRFGARSGVHPSGIDAVSLSGDTITVHDTAGVIYTALNEAVGPYAFQMLEATHALDPADSANDRIDLVVAHQYDADEDASGLRTLISEYLKGEAGVGPQPVPSGAEEWARVTVPADGTGSPTLEFTSPYHVAAGGVIPIRDASELPGTDPGTYDGLVIWNRATDELLVHNGASTFERLAGIGDHELAYGTGGDSAQVNLTGSDQTLVSAPVTIPAHWQSWTAEVHATVEVSNNAVGGASPNSDRLLQLHTDDGSSQIGYTWPHTVTTTQDDDLLSFTSTNPSGSTGTGVFTFRLRAALSTDDNYLVQRRTLAVTVHRLT